MKEEHTVREHLEELGEAAVNLLAHLDGVLEILGMAPRAKDDASEPSETLRISTIFQQIAACRRLIREAQETLAGIACQLRRL